MSKALSSSEPRQQQTSSQHGFHQKHQSHKKAIGKAENDGVVARSGRHKRHKIVYKFTSSKVKATHDAEIVNPRHQPAHQGVNRNEASKVKRSGGHVSHWQSHHHSSHQVKIIKSSVHGSSGQQIPLMQHNNIVQQTNGSDHQQPHSPGSILPYAKHSEAHERQSNASVWSSNQLSGASRAVNATLKPLVGLKSSLPTETIRSIKSTNPLNTIMLIGLPICACLMFSLLFLLLLKYCKCLKRACKAKQKSSTMKKNSNKMKKFMSSPIGLISNGKTLNYTGSSDLNSVKIVKSKDSVQDDYGKTLDCRQLTINMDGCTDSTTDDSDELQQQQPPNEPGKQKTKKSNKPGMLKYALEYDFNQSILSVTIIEARELPAMDLNGSSDPYVSVFMANNKNYQTFKTKIHKRTLNPVFNEEFKYQISYAELTNQTLILSVYDYDRLSKHDEIGQLELPLSSIDLSQRQVNWSELHKKNDATNGRLGDICLSLRYVPTAGRLNVVILEARQLKKMDVAGLSDPYVKLALTSNGKRLKKKKTSIKKCTLNPHYNESFSFELPFEQAQEVQLVITVVDYDRIGTSEPIGMIALGCVQATGETELRHWMDMLASPRRPIARWHTLRSIEYEQSKPPKLQTRRLSRFIANKKTRD